MYIYVNIILRTSDELKNGNNDKTFEENCEMILATGW